MEVWAINVSPNGTVCSNGHIKCRRKQLCGTFLKFQQLPEEEMQALQHLLVEYHDTFSLTEYERGETDLVEFNIDTGNAYPKKQAVRRVPFAARQEIEDQLAKMQKMNVIRSSQIPWASLVVLVRKRDGTLRFCVDYRGLNSMKKPDLHSLPRISDLLDQLGKSKFFSTLDLKSGYWQIKVNADSQEKIAFVTHKGL